MVRKRFNADERTFLTPDAKIEWRNGSHWHPATVRGPITRSDDGWDRVWIENHATTRTVGAGQTFYGSPGAVRRATPPPTVLDTFRAASDAHQEPSATYPYVNVDGVTVWACCLSGIGPVCQHRSDTKWADQLPSAERKRARSPERVQFLTDLLITAIEHSGYGFAGALEWEPKEDGTAYAVVYDRYDEEESNEPPATTWRVDLDTMAKGLGVIRRAVAKVDDAYPADGEILHNAATGERLYVGEELRRELLLCDRTNGAEGDYDVVGALAVLECALFGKVVYA